MTSAPANTDWATWRHIREPDGTIWLTVEAVPARAKGFFIPLAAAITVTIVLLIAFTGLDLALGPILALLAGAGTAVGVAAFRASRAVADFSLRAWSNGLSIQQRRFRGRRLQSASWSLRPDQLVTLEAVSLDAGNTEIRIVADKPISGAFADEQTEVRLLVPAPVDRVAEPIRMIREALRHG